MQNKYELAVLSAVNTVKASGAPVTVEAVTEKFVENVQKVEELAKIHAKFDKILAHMSYGNTVTVSVKAEIEKLKASMFDWATRQDNMLAKEQAQYDAAIAAFEAAAGAAIAASTGGAGSPAMIAALLPAVSSLLTATGVM